MSPSWIFATILLVAFTIERACAAFIFRHCVAPSRLSAVLFALPAASYVLIGYGSYLEFVIAEKKLHFFSSLVGAFVFGSGIYLRRRAMRTLGGNWTLYTEPLSDSGLVTEGIYSVMRHPYYFSVVLELAGFCMILNSYVSFFLVAIIQIPLLVVRTVYEEKFLADKYGKAYEIYRQRIPCLPVINPRALKNVVPFQTINLIRIVGIRGLIRMFVVHRRMIRYSRPYMVFHCLMALSNIGFLDAMKRSEHVRLEDFSHGKSVATDILEAVCDYLYQVKILNLDTRGYSLSHEGRVLSGLSIGAFDLLHGYAPIFENLEALVTKKAHYPIDVSRRERHMAKGSTELTKYLPSPAARDIIRRRRFRSVADLGCGNGQFLVNLVKCNHGITGIGVDSSSDVVNDAVRYIQNEGLTDKIRIVHGDIRNIEVFKDELKYAELLCAMFVVHEFFYDGYEKGIQVLNRVARALPNKYLLISELMRQTNSALRKKNTSISEHHLIHRLSKQGLVTRDKWRDIFQAAGFALVDETYFDFSAQAYFLLKS